MKIVCLDLEGVLVPEIWIAFADAVKIPVLRRTTRDEPDYDKLMNFRLDILDKNKLKLPDIQEVIGKLDPLEGAANFVEELRKRSELIILSDTFTQFAKPLMAKLGYPTLFCNSLTVLADGTVTGYKLRQKDGKMHAVKAFKSLNLDVFAAGDSFNDLKMIREADAGCLFRAPESIRESEKDIPCVDAYTALLEHIDAFLNRDPL
ncbi:MAG: bifunctional phosphoserine phosphatase/homoserine phosphotransferase ThrH [Treponema sp.]|jgi:phosphoserine/homoserine phosphotransferase|nr:bifunctional phosphoserine phosphatase/homoserine phosphotransferase ThrH [Treponema sp.]